MTALLCLCTYLKTTPTRIYMSGPGTCKIAKHVGLACKCTLKAVTKQTKKQERLGGKSDS